MVFPFSGHNFELRYWLAAAGVHPDRDVRLVAIPPPLMVESLRLGHVDGFCVGEPWNSIAVAEGLGRIIATKSQLFPGGVEKVLAVHAALEADPDRLAKLLRALSAAAAWADVATHHDELAEWLSRPEYLGVPADVIAAALGGRIDLGGGRRVRDPDFMFFHRHAAGVPSSAEALWLYAQMVRWGQLAGSAQHEAIAGRVFRPDLYRRFLGTGDTEAGIEAFDGVEFGRDNLGAYLRQFELQTPFIDSRVAFEP
jgi:NitT/TauT family transport system ATP-binding protein